MAGRAGRRGIDLFGSVYILCSADLLPDTKVSYQISKIMLML